MAKTHGHLPLTPPGRGGLSGPEGSHQLIPLRAEGRGPRAWPRAGCELPEASGQAQSQALPLPPEHRKHGGVSGTRATHEPVPDAAGTAGLTQNSPVLLWKPVQELQPEGQASGLVWGHLGTSDLLSGDLGWRHHLCSPSASLQLAHVSHGGACSHQPSFVFFFSTIAQETHPDGLAPAASRAHTWVPQDSMCLHTVNLLPQGLASNQPEFRC